MIGGAGLECGDETSSGAGASAAEGWWHDGVVWIVAVVGPQPCCRAGSIHLAMSGKLAGLGGWMGECMGGPPGPARPQLNKARVNG